MKKFGNPLAGDMDALQSLYGQVQQPQQQQRMQQQSFPQESSYLQARHPQQQQWPNQQQFQQQQQRPMTPPPRMQMNPQRTSFQYQQPWQNQQLQRPFTPPPSYMIQQQQQRRSITPYMQQQQRPQQPYFQQQDQWINQQRRSATPPPYLQQEFQQQSPYNFQQWPDQQQQPLRPRTAPAQQQQQYYGSQQQYAGPSHRPAPPPPRTRVSQAIVPEPSAIASTSSSAQQVHSTLTEPVSVTLRRDVTRVGHNLKQIVAFNSNRNDPARTLRDWDLWGPFFFIIAMSCILSSSATNNKSTVFAVVFAVLSSGAVSLTMNVVLLGGKLNFLQSLSVLGYCLFPLDIGAILCVAYTNKIYRSIVVLTTLLWCSWSIYPFVSTAVRPSRKVLAVYPVFLMYISMGLLVLAND